MSIAHFSLSESCGTAHCTPCAESTATNSAEQPTRLRQTPSGLSRPNTGTVSSRQTGRSDVESPGRPIIPEPIRFRVNHRCRLTRIRIGTSVAFLLLTKDGDICTVEPTEKRTRGETMSSRDAHWSIAGRFSTLESAERLLNQLHVRGLEGYVTLIGGLSVIARNGAAGSLISQSNRTGRTRLHPVARTASTA